MALKIIHCADIHFDSAMSGMKDTTKLNIRHEDIKETFKKIIALSKNADALLIAGDLFDGKRVMRTTLNFLKEEFAKIPDVNVFIIAGNHDYICENSPYKTFDFGENVHIFGTEAECVEEEKFDIYGMSFKTPNDEREMLKSMNIKSHDKINLCLMHGNLSGTDYNPIKISDIEKSGFDYLALGHIHKATDVKKANKTFYAYSGCPEGRGNDETGEKGVYAIELVKGNILNASFVPVCTRKYFDETVDITDADSYDKILEKINKHHYGDEHFYRFTLVGQSDMSIDTDLIKEKLSGFSVVVRDNTTPCINIEELSKEFSLKGLFLKYALEDSKNLTEEEFNDAIKSGLYYIEKEENNEN